MQHDGPLQPQGAAPAPRTAPGIAERAAAAAPTVLVVDDERSIRDLLRRLLERAGFHVLTAAHGAEAVERFAEQPGAIDLVITDVRMPEMTGPELADRLAELHHRAKILYISGYGAPLLAANGADGLGALFLQKPFTSAALVAKVREILAASEARAD